MKQHTFLASFCNNKANICGDTGRGYLAKIHIDSSGLLSMTPVDLQLGDGLVGNGITGLTRFNGGYLAVLQTPPSTLLFLNSDFSLDNKIELTGLGGLKGVHSVCCEKDTIYLAVTNQDRIVSIDAKGTYREEWSNQTMQDTIHLNSICFNKDQPENRLLATCFGPKASNLWSSANQGTAFDTHSDTTVIEQLWHPHSICAVDGQIMCCDSSRQRVVSDTHGCLVDDLPGYARGLYVDKNTLICGTSKGRLVSHSTGVVVGNKSDKGDLGGQCGVNYYKADDSGQYQLISQLNLDDCAEEIYDIVPIIQRA